MKNFFHKISRSILFVGVFLYVVFEELVWDLLAEPIYNYVRNLRPLQAIERAVKNLTPLTVLILFLALFIQVEGLGVLALALMAQGKPILGVILYLAKLPVAAFTFWLFRVCKGILMTFVWFKFGYERLERLIHFLKSSEIHQRIITIAKQLKAWLKYHSQKIKQALGLAKNPL